MLCPPREFGYPPGTVRTLRLLNVVAPLALGLLLAPTACTKKGTTAPGEKGKSAEEVEKEKAAAADKAKVQGLIELANTDLSNGRYVSARRRAEEALADDPKNADAYTVLGAAEWRAGNFEASTDAYRKALELDPKNFGAAVDLSRNLRAMSQYDDALKVLEPVIAAEGEGFTSKACESLEDCVDEGGWCHPTEKVCKAPVQIQTRRSQLWGFYTTLEADKGIQVADEVFLGAAAEDEATMAILEVVRAYADYLRPLQGKALVELEGESATVNDFGIDAFTGVKHAFAIVGGEPSRVGFSEVQIDSRVSPEAVERMGLKPLAKVKVFGLGDEEVDLVLVPEIDLQGLKIKNVPAIVQDLSYYEGGMGEVPAIVLGHQVLHRLGSLTADFPAGKMTITKAPASAPAGAVELPLVMLDQWYIHIPITKVGIDGSEFRFWAWFGGIHPTAIATTAKTYLKSNHLPRDIENPEDAETGRKMVFVDEVRFGSASLPGVGGLVFLDQPGDAGLDGVRDSNGLVGFEIGGYVNAALMKQIVVTYGYGQGKLWVQTPAAK